MATIQKSGNLVRKGMRGDEVRELQNKLSRLGFDVTADGVFGDATESVVIQLQTLFGYSVDGIVGDGTRALIDAQIAHGWNTKLPNAKELAMQSQSRGKPQDQPNMNPASKKPMNAPAPTPSKR